MCRIAKGYIMDKTSKIDEVLEDEAAKLEAEAETAAEDDPGATIMMPAIDLEAEASEPATAAPVEKPPAINPAVINPRADIAALDALENDLFALGYALG